jgi:hypothetical protein
VVEDKGMLPKGDKRYIQSTLQQIILYAILVRLLLSLGYKGQTSICAYIPGLGAPAGGKTMVY